MSRVAVMMSADHVDEQMSSHFGKAEWIMVAETENHVFSFIKNEVLNGKSMVELVMDQSCTDVIFTEIGNGAFGQLKSAGIHGWVAPANINGEQALQMYEHARLQPAHSATEGHGGQGCCCASQTAVSTTCCRG